MARASCERPFGIRTCLLLMLVMLTAYSCQLPGANSPDKTHGRSITWSPDQGDVMSNLTMGHPFAKADIQTQPISHVRRNVQLLTSPAVLPQVMRGWTSTIDGIMGDVASAERFLTDNGQHPDINGLRGQRSDIIALKISSSRAWTRQQYDPTHAGRLGTVDSFAGIRRALTALTVGQYDIWEFGRLWMKKRSVRVERYPNGPNVGFESTQDNTYFDQRISRSASRARCSIVFNVVDGVIILQDEISAEEATRGERSGLGRATDDLPPMQGWSDVAFFNWRLLHDSMIRHRSFDFRRMLLGSPIPLTYSSLLRMVTFLNYVILQRKTISIDTERVIATCLHSRGKEYAKRPTWDERQTFAVGHWCFFALFGDVSNYGLAMLLMTHKGEEEGLGDKCYASVTLFFPDANDQHSQPAGATPVQIWEVQNRDICTVSLHQLQDWHPQEDFVNKIVHTTGGFGQLAGRDPPGTSSHS